VAAVDDDGGSGGGGGGGGGQGVGIIITLLLEMCGRRALRQESESYLNSIPVYEIRNHKSFNETC
jgi:hypothetical protein